MAFKSYNNNERQITNSTYSGVSFSNPESNIAKTKISISYFNKIMKISIALRNNAGSQDNFATYDNDNAVTVYVSNIKAKILSNMIDKLRTDKDVHNVCIELKNGLMKISDGSEYGCQSPCISISYASEDGSVHEIIYETKKGFHTAAYNYADDSYKTETFDDIELDTFQMCLEEYYKASSYAIAASVMEANMYKRNAEYELLRAVADKVGVQNNNGGNSARFNNKTFLSGNSSSSNSSNNNGEINGIPKEYESSTFDDIANSLS